MQKTVDINENSNFMEDLELLSTVQDEAPNFTVETSPEQLQDGLGSFKLKGVNPLERLGLYMKEDDEEEEEVDPPQQQEPPVKAVDVEEGEID